LRSAIQGRHVGFDKMYLLMEAQAKARSAGVDSTPTLIFSGPSGQETIDELRDYDQISQAMDRVDGS
jgi:protein-disulfide isomerase